jgi:REP element-mobilizing transposase RayT
MQQLALIRAPNLFHGGEIAKGKRKLRRPLARKRPIHLVLKATKKNLYSHRKNIQESSQIIAKKFSVKIYNMAVNHDHVHYILKIADRKSYCAFIRALTSIFARKIGTGLWKILPFTRILAWGKDFRRVQAYLSQNSKEAAGLVPYKQRKNFYLRQPKMPLARSQHT